MGSPVGTFSDDEVKDLSPADREKLKKLALRELAASRAIRSIIAKCPTLLTTDPSINKILRKKLAPKLAKLKKKKK
jgi:hypothetical protein